MNRYKLSRELGIGSYGVVYEGIHLATGDTVRIWGFGGIRCLTGERVS